MEWALWVGVAAAAAGFRWWRKKRDRARAFAISAWAGTAGLRFEPIDLTGQRLWRPFRLFGEGDERGIENIAHGEFNGVHLELFDYWYAVEETQRPARSLGHPTTLRTKQYRRFTCGLATAPGGASWPHLSIAPESFASKLKARAGFRDIEFESEAFNRMFEVQATDRKFAYDVIDARMMSWLMMTDGRYEVELRDQDVLLVSDRLPAEKWHHLALAVAGCIQRLPSTAVRRPASEQVRPDVPLSPDRPQRAGDDFGYFA